MKENGIPISLLISISEDDQIAFRKLYDHFYLRLFRFCGYLVKSSELREEIVSDVFLSIWQNRERILKIENFEAYLYTMARNRALYFIKQRKTELASQDAVLPVEIILNETPETNVEKEELRISIEKAVNELPERCRLIFLLAKEEGLKYRQIAEILSISEKTVNAQMVTALKKLSETLKKVLHMLLLI